jgi:hypothetical protein
MSATRQKSNKRRQQRAAAQYQRRVAQIAARHGKSVNDLLAQIKNPRKSKTPVKKERINYEDKQGDFHLYALTEDKVAENNAILLARLREIRCMAGLNPDDEYIISPEPDDKNLIFTDSSLDSDEI